MEICGLIEEKTVKLMSVLDLIDGVAKIIELVEYNPVVAIELEDDPVIL